MRAWPVLLLLALAAAGCTAPQDPGREPPGPQAPVPGFNPLVRLGTDRGDVYIEVFQEMVPVTADHFLDLVRSRFYEGTKVHRVLTGAFVEMGDPTTRDLTKPRETWGSGDPGLERIPDEFHADLRLSEAGVVAMSNTGPGTGTSQFFITLAPQPNRNDHHTVFGQVVAGMEVVEAIGEEQVTNVGNATSVPVEDIVVRSTEVLEARRDPAEVRHGLQGWTYTPALNTTPNHTIQFAVLVKNTGNVRTTYDLNVTLPEGWRALLVCPGATRRADCPFDRTLGAGAAQVALVQVRTPLNLRFGEQRVVVQATSAEARAEVPVTVRVGTLGERAGPGDVVTLDYVGYLSDGRVFDSSRFDIIGNASVPKKALANPRSTDPDDYTPLVFQVGGRQVVPGFEFAATELRQGESGAALLPPHLAYGPTFQGHVLAGQWLLFDMELLAVRE